MSSREENKDCILQRNKTTILNLVVTTLFSLRSGFCFVSSAGASSPAIPVNAGSVEWLGHGQASKGSSRSHAVRQPPRPSLSTSAACYAPGSMQVSCRPWERGDLLRRLSTFNPSNWFAKPKVLHLNTVFFPSYSDVEVWQLSNFFLVLHKDVQRNSAALNFFTLMSNMKQPRT